MLLRELLADVIEVQRKAIYDNIVLSERFRIFIFILTNYNSICKILKSNRRFKRSRLRIITILLI